MRSRSLAGFFLFALIMMPAWGISQSAPAATAAPTEISADLGSCSALFTVTGKDAKPIYNVKISTRIRYGVLGAKKLDLETFTNSTGQAKFINLPEAPKKPIYFYVSKDDKLEIVEFAPDVRCQATFDVALK
jgi:hypothetical protein